MYDFNNNNHAVMQHPSIAIIGNLGSGKTAVATFIALMFNKYCEKNNLKGYKIFANYTIDLPNFVKIKAHDIVKFSPHLKNGILIIDEVHSEGGDSYNFLGKIEKKMTTFFTQIRKRNLAVLTTSQHMSFVLPRIRKLTYYYIHAVRTNEENQTLMRVVARDNYELINEIPIDRELVYDIYDTNEIISEDEIKEIDELVSKKNE